MRGLVAILSRLWPWRVGLAAALVVAMGMALAAVVLRERSLEPLILRAMDRAPRIAAGLSLAHERLTLSALEARANATPPSRLASDLATFLAAIASLEEEDQRALFADVPRFADLLDRLRGFRAETEALEVALREGEGGPPPALLATLALELAQLRDPLSDLIDSAIARQRLEIVRRTREVRQADRVVIATSTLAVLLGGLLLLVLMAGRGADRVADASSSAAQPPLAGVDPQLVAQAGRDLAASLHRTIGRLGLLVGADGAAAEPLRASQESAETALATAELLADAALLLAGQRAPQHTPFEPERVLRQALDEPGAPQVSVQTEVGMPRLWRGDPARFVALARALLNSAASAGPVPPRVLLAAEADGLVVTIGEGNDAPWEPIDPAASASGFAAAALMVHALGGRLLRLRPTAGRAEQLRLHLPFTPLAGEEAVSPEGGGLRVLAVDDVAVNRQLLVTLLERHGHRCETAADAEAALARLSAGGIDVVLLDVRMPGIDGVTAARLIRSLPPPVGSVPIVAVTAQCAAEERDALRAAGVVEVIEKPISSAELLLALSRAVGSEVPPARPAEPAIDRAALALLRSTLSDQSYDQLITEALMVAETVLAEAEAAEALSDRARLDAALDRLCSAFEPFGAARLAGVVAGLRRGEADLLDLRRTVEETTQALARGNVLPAAADPIPART